MKFRLEFDIPPFEKRISPADALFFAGSCFSENIASRFERYKFSVISNSHGILYNPHSIAVSLTDCIANKTYSEKDLFYANECWNSFNHHSRFSQTDKAVCISSINSAITGAHKQLKNCSHLFITFGSAFIYHLKESGEPVGNCHKVPQKQFEKRLLKKEDIVNQYNELLHKIKALNPSVRIILTVSPVRYIRDGVAENNVSKAILLQAVHELVDSNELCSYFPAYEIVNDELRDYRFFEEDLVHPSKPAIDYVWERLKQAAFNEQSHHYVSELEAILNAASHRPFNDQSEAHKKFKETFLLKCRELKKKFPHPDLEEEEKIFST